MKSLVQFIGYVVLFFYVLAWFGVVDFNLCIGKPGTCTQNQPARPGMSALKAAL